MRIALITTDVREFLRNYLPPLPSFGTAPTALLEGFKSLPEVEIHVISCARQRMRPQERLADNIWFHSVHVPRIGWMRTGYLGCILAVRKKLKNIRPDVVHGQGTELDCALDAAFSGFPNIITIHGNMRVIADLLRARPFSFMWNSARLEAFAISRCGGVLCITEHTRRIVAPLARRFWLVPNAVDSSFFALEKKTNPGAPPLIVCIGVVCALKNQNAFIRALDGLACKYSFRTLFLGKLDSDQAYASEFKDLIRARSWCQHAGFANRNEIKAFLSQASLLVLPSLEDNCPMVVLEAMAAGVPVIASRVGGIPDLIEDGKTGFFCDPYSLESIAAAVEKVLSAPVRAQEIAHWAKANARDSFHPRIIASKHLDIYRQLC